MPPRLKPNYYYQKACALGPTGTYKSPAEGCTLLPRPNPHTTTAQPKAVHFSPGPSSAHNLAGFGAQPQYYYTPGPMCTTHQPPAGITGFGVPPIAAVAAQPQPGTPGRAAGGIASAPAPPLRHHPLPKAVHFSPSPTSLHNGRRNLYSA